MQEGRTSADNLRILPDPVDMGFHEEQHGRQPDANERADHAGEQFPRREPEGPAPAESPETSSGQVEMTGN